MAFLPSTIGRSPTLQGIFLLTLNSAHRDQDHVRGRVLCDHVSDERRVFHLYRYSSCRLWTNTLTTPYLHHVPSTIS